MDAQPPTQFPSDVSLIQPGEYDQYGISEPSDSAIQQNSYLDEIGSSCVWQARSWAFPFWFWTFRFAYLGSYSQSNYLIDYIDVINYRWVDWWFLGGIYVARLNAADAGVNVVYSYSGNHFWLSMGDHYFYDNPPACQGMPIAWNPITYWPGYF